MIIEKDKAIMDINDFLYELTQNMTENSLMELIECFAWTPKVFQKVVDMLISEFSREHYNQFIHEGREKFLKSLKEEEIKYYADSIASKIEKYKKENQDYWKLYHHFRELFGYEAIKNYPQPAEIDFDLRSELAKIIEETLKQKED
jgi:hypothetical protein